MLLAMCILLADKDVTLYASKILFIMLEQASHHDSGYYEPVPLKRNYEESK
jgi:hypothetical protein